MTTTQSRTQREIDDGRAVVIVTRPDDMTADLVVSELNTRSVPVVRFDAADFPREVTVAAEIGDGQGISGILRTSSRCVDLSAVRSLYYRRPSRFAFPGLERQDAHFATVQARYGFGGVLTSLPDCLYVNHPHRIADAEFKPAQLTAAVAMGFDVPPTLITNDPESARQFIRSRERVIFKAIRSTDYELNGEPATIWTQEVTAPDIDDRISGTMHLFQEMVRKKYDLRVTVVRNYTFAVRIESPLIDWRSDYSQVTYARAEISDQMARQMRRYLRHFGLEFGCFDFAIDKNDQTLFLECNPNGQWAWLEAETGLPITAAFAEVLERH